MRSTILRPIAGLFAASGLAFVLASCTSLDKLQPPCVYVVSPTSASFNGNGGSATIAISAAAGCGWSAKSESSWLKFSGNTQGTGDGKVTYNVDPNSDDKARNGKLVVAQQDIAVSQAPVTCDYSINQTSAKFGAGGGNGTIMVTAPDGCVSTASTAATWVVITAGCICIGNGEVDYTVSANPSTQARQATIIVAGYTFSITQDGKSSAVALSKGPIDELGRFVLNRPQVSRVAEAFRVDLVGRLGS